MDEADPDRRAPSIFISYAHEDRSFAQRIKRELETNGIKVWIDDSELRVGDDLLRTLTRAIDESDFLSVIISAHTAQSDWVRREVEAALEAERDGRVKVIPLLRRGGELPPNLSERNYADFRSERTYAAAINDILVRLGATRADDEPVDRLTELTGEYPLLKAALQELRSEGITIATSDAITASSIDDFDLSDFARLVAEELTGQKLFGLALSIIPWIDQHEVGHDALDFCLDSGRLDDWQISTIGAQMQYVTTPDAVSWCHARLTERIRNDPHYHSFLVRHAEYLLAHHLDDVTAYLLYPDRGPGRYNVDAFGFVMNRTGRAGPFAQRWRDWLYNRYFDSRELDGFESARMHYLVLNRYWGQPAFKDLVDASEQWVYLLFKSGDAKDFDRALYYTVAMVDAPYRGAGPMAARIVEGVDIPLDRWDLVTPILTGLRAAAVAPSGPMLPQTDDVRDAIIAIHAADDGITGYWRA